ncbi:MAG: sigma-54 dependent transcriptional regulator [Terrimicrobiaceae bacterium]
MVSTAPQCLILDPAREYSAGFRRVLEGEGWRVDEVRAFRAALEWVANDPPNLLITPPLVEKGGRGLKGRGMMEELRAVCADVEIIAVGQNADVQTAMGAVRRGAFDFLPLPCEAGILLEAVSRAMAHQNMAAEDARLLARIRSIESADAMEGESEEMRRVQDAVTRVADTDVTILLTGESGTGKEMVARKVHNMSRRKDGPFIAVNCAALPDSLIESEFFGHVKGAFTGAMADKPGRFELARGGTLFLDEIGDLSAFGQADLLRVLDNGIFRPLGSRTTMRADARIVAATNRDLAARCRDGLFRDDLLYRLSVVTLHLPPLRERPEDIIRLATRFVDHFCARHRRTPKRISDELMQVLMRLPWPGNVRELRNTVERMVLLEASRELKPGHLPPHLQGDHNDQLSGWHPGLTLAQVEEQWIRRTLLSSGGNKSETARRLGISVRALHYKLGRKK